MEVSFITIGLGRAVICRLLHQKLENLLFLENRLLVMLKFGNCSGNVMKVQWLGFVYDKVVKRISPWWLLPHTVGAQDLQVKAQMCPFWH